MSSHPTVVVVEQDPLLRKMICEELEEHQIHAEHVALAQDALSLLAKKTPDGILLEFPYPIDGAFDVLEFMKEQKKKIPVIVMTNLNLEEEEVRQLGACKLLVKSDIDCTGIYHALKNHL